jgi:acyl carrier protein
MFRFQIPHRFRTELRDQQMPAAVDLSRAPDGGTKLDLGGLIVELRNPVRSVAYHPIDLEMVEAGGEVAGYLHYWPDVFDQSTIVRFAEDYVRLLEEAANDPQRRVSSFAARGVAGSVGDEPRASGGGQQPVPVRRPTATEERIARIWASVLSVRTVHPGECFRDLGGDSLAAVESAARIAAEFGREIALPMLMGSPTLAELAAHIDAMVTGRPPG